MKAYQGLANVDGIERTTKIYKSHSVTSQWYMRGNLQQPKCFGPSYKVLDVGHWISTKKVELLTKTLNSVGAATIINK